MKKSKLNIALWLWNGLGMCVIIGYFVFSLAIGGSAWNGYVDGVSHYVGEHGNYVLVSEQIWNISDIWNALFYVFLLLTPIGGFLITIIHKKLTKNWP